MDTWYLNNDLLSSVDIKKLKEEIAIQIAIQFYGRHLSQVYLLDVDGAELCRGTAEQIIPLFQRYTSQVKAEAVEKERERIRFNKDEREHILTALRNYWEESPKWKSLSSSVMKKLDRQALKESNDKN